MPLQTVTKGALPLASDVNQIVNALDGKTDIGAIVYPSQTSAPSTAPTVTLSSGSITGTGYQWGFYWITGTVNDSGTVSVTGRTTVSPYSTAQSLTSEQATVSISGITIPTAVIGWGVVRNKSGGSTWYEVPGSEQFGNSDGTNIPVTYVDDTADANLVTAEPSSNTTGTSITGDINATSLNSPNPWYMENGLGSGHETEFSSGQTVNGTTYDLFAIAENGVSWIFGVDHSGNQGIAGSFVAAGSITSSAGELGSASGTWTPASGSLNVAVGTVINIAAVPTSCVSFFTTDVAGGDGSSWGITTSSGGAWYTSGNSQGYASAISSTTVTGAAVTVDDGSYHASGYFQVNGGYIQFVVTSTIATNGTPSDIRWGVS